MLVTGARPHTRDAQTSSGEGAGKKTLDVTGVYGGTEEACLPAPGSRGARGRGRERRDPFGRHEVTWAMSH